MKTHAYFDAYLFAFIIIIIIIMCICIFKILSITKKKNKIDTFSLISYEFRHTILIIKLQEKYIKQIQIYNTIDIIILKQLCHMFHS